jgi:hypothetical protein
MDSFFFFFFGGTMYSTLINFNSHSEILEKYYSLSVIFKLEGKSGFLRREILHIWLYTMTYSTALVKISDGDIK